MYRIKRYAVTILHHRRGRDRFLFGKEAEVMEINERKFFKINPEGAVIIALDSREDALLFGAVELRGGEEAWLDFELEPGPDGDIVSLYRGTEDLPMLEYCARGRRVDLITHTDRLLILWNHGRQALAVDGEPLSSGELSASAPKSVTPWLLRFARWLPRRGQ